MGEWFGRSGFGLGDDNRPVDVTVRWIGGEESRHEGLAVDRRHRLAPGDGAVGRSIP